jgi:hypothetical protein
MLETSGTGNIIVNGTGGDGGGSSYGVEVASGGPSSLITTGTGDITVIGTGGNNDYGANDGVLLAIGSISSNGGSISVSGTGGSGAGNNNYGIELTNWGWGSPETISNTGAGTITLNGVAGGTGVSSGNYGVYNAGGNVTTVNGNILVNASSGNAIGVGNEGLVMTSATSSAISSSGSGNITVVTDTDSFGAASNLSTAAGRWLVYSANPANNNDSVLTPSFVRYNCTYGGACPAFPSTGDGLLYSFTPVLTATPSGTSVIYGSAVQPPLAGYGYTLSGYLGNDARTDTVAGSLDGTTNYTVGVGAGAYGINYASGSLTSSLGYSFVYANNPAAIVVTPYVLSVIANAQSKVYGAADQTFTYNYGALQNGDTSGVFTGTLGRAAGENVGSYGINQGSLSAGPNYALSFTGNHLTITPAPLLITANNISMAYGVAPVLTVSYTGLANGDTAASLTKQPVVVSGTSFKSNVGIYKNTLTASGAVDPNYTISYAAPGNLTIIPYTLDIAANAVSKVYGTLADPALTWALVNGTSLQNGNLPSTIRGALTRVAGQNAGTYAINQGTLTAGANYTISYTGNNLTILPYTLAVSAVAKSKVYGAADPALTYTHGLLRNGDLVTVFTGSLTRVAGENAGTYAIGEGTLSAGPNYTISYTGANLTITPYTLAVKASPETKVYGSADPALTYTYGALQNGDTASVLTGNLVRVAGENVGAYRINQGTLSAGPNYKISYTSNFLTITPYVLSVAADAETKVYGSSDPALTYTYGALQNGDTAAVFTGALHRVAGQNVGSYAINPFTLSAGPNYKISYTSNFLTITPYTLTVTANAASKVYGAADPALTYTHGALQEGDLAGLVFSGSLSRAAGQNVGAYAISQGTLSAGKNYIINFVGNNLTITPYVLSVKANAETKVAGAADPALTYTFGLLRNGDTASVFTGGLARAAGETAGIYAIGEGTLSAGSNYSISYTSNELTITP